MAKTYEIIIIVLLALVFVKMFFPKMMSGYMLGYPLNVSGTGVEPRKFWDLNDTLACTPGPSKDAAYFNRTSNPGGICGDQQFVNDAMRKYTIVD
jgi:hypothetical protein